MIEINWGSTRELSPRSYKCGYCNFTVSSNKGWQGESYSGPKFYYNVVICSNCNKPTYFSQSAQVPGNYPGVDVGHLPPDISAVYNESRKSVMVGAYTASVLMSRKLLMNIAVSHGAKEGESFMFYIQYLSDAGYIPPNGKAWVDHIRKKGNEATHEIALKSKKDAEELVSFSEMLLKFIYEFPATIPQPLSTPTPP